MQELKNYSCRGSVSIFTWNITLKSKRINFWEIYLFLKVLANTFPHSVNPSKGSSLCTQHSVSSLLPVGELMPNKCNIRIKPNNPGSSKRVLNAEYVSSLKYKTVQVDKGIEPLYHLEIESWSRFKGGLKSSQGKIDAGERSETAFILLAKKADRHPSYPRVPPGLGSQHKASDQKRRKELYSLQANVMCIQINFSWSDTNRLYR